MEYDVIEGVRYHTVPTLIVCIEDCYPNNDGKPLGVFIRGYHQLCLEKKSLWLQCDNGSEKVRVDMDRLCAWLLQ